MGKFYDLIQAHIDAQEYPVSERQIAIRLGVTQTAMARWHDPRALPDKANLVAVAQLTRVPYERVLYCVLEDIGYIP